jgi:Zn-dependent membrane protease YugP
MMMPFFNPLYSDPMYLILMVVGMGLVFIPQMWVKNTFNKYNEIAASRGLTGADVARAILRENGLGHVDVEAVQGFLSDHYDPMSKKIRLSADNYYGRAIANIAVSAHECGHALQHAKGYFPVVVRGAMVPAVNLGSQLGPLLIMLSLVMGIGMNLGGEIAWMMAWAGVALFGLSVVFHIVTLPVELDASGRALRVLSSHNYLTSKEMPGARKVLTAAAFTYVATALYSLMQLAYYIWMLMGRRGNDDR